MRSTNDRTAQAVRPESTLGAAPGGSAQGVAAAGMFTRFQWVNQVVTSGFAFLFSGVSLALLGQASMHMAVLLGELVFATGGAIAALGMVAVLSYGNALDAAKSGPRPADRRLLARLRRVIPSPSWALVAICFSVIGADLFMQFLAMLAVGYFLAWDDLLFHSGLMFALGLFAMILMALLRYKNERKRQESPPFPDPSPRVCELALNVKTRSEAVQEYARNAGVAPQQAEQAVSDWLRRHPPPSGKGRP